MMSARGRDYVIRRCYGFLASFNNKFVHLPHVHTACQAAHAAMESVARCHKLQHIG